jgi:replicative DNA helicase
VSLHNLDAEQALLGALLYDNRLLERLPALTGAHFFEPLHGDMFEEAARLIRANRAATATTLLAWAKEHIPADIGGTTYLLDLLASAALPTHAVEYAGEITGLALQREIAAIGRELEDNAQRGDPLEALAAAEAQLRALELQSVTINSADAPEAGEAFIAGLTRPAILTGYTALDERLGGLMRGDLIILGGRPSMGKTALGTEIGRNVARRGGAVHLASLEMSKEQIARRCIGAATFHEASALDRIEYFRLRPGATGFDMDKLHGIAATLPRSLIIDDRPAQTVAQIEAGARATRRRLGRLDLIVVDYLQLMRAASRVGNRVHEIEETTQGLKALAKRLDCPVLALCQLSRAIEGREDKRPQLADLRDSGAIEQDADVVLAVYREAYYLQRSAPPQGDEGWFEWDAKLQRVRRVMEVLTLKQRQGETGRDELEAHLEFDTILNAPRPRPNLRAVQ